MPPNTVVTMAVLCTLGTQLLKKWQVQDPTDCLATDGSSNVGQ